MMSGEAVVPGYYLVGYNQPFLAICGTLAVVPGYYLVCYNIRSVHLLPYML